MSNSKKYLHLLLKIDQCSVQRIEIPVPGSEGAGWQFGLKHNSTSELDKTVVEIIDEDGDVITTYNHVYAAGEVIDEVYIGIPERIQFIEKCPNCGWSQFSSEPVISHD